MIRFAFRFIKYDKIKSLGVVIGILISTFLVGQQTGIFIFLTSAMSSLVDNTSTDLWMVDNRSTNANALGLIDVRLGRQAESLEGVKKAYPLLVTGGQAKFLNGKPSPVTLVGVQSPRFKGAPWNFVEGKVEDLVEEGAVSTDVFDSRDLNGARRGTQFEISGRKVFVAAQTRGVRGFGGIYVFTTLERARTLGGIPPDKVSAFLLDIEEGADPLAVRDRINASLPLVRAWIKKDFSRATVSTILSTSGIAFSVGTLIIFATVSGMIIIGLTMYSAAVDRLRDYGTLKAVGASNRSIRSLILTQALSFSMVGYGLAVLLIEGFRSGIAQSGILFEFSLPVKAAFFVGNLLISLGGASFAMRRISKVEPASVFRG